MTLTLFKRIYSAQVGQVDCSKLDISFNIKRSLRQSQNTCELVVYNLTRDHLAQIRTTSPLYVEVAAGYEANGLPPNIIFRGNAGREVYIKSEKTENILTLKARDGLVSTRGRINRSYDPRTPIRTVLTDLINAMNVGSGNLEDFLGERLTTTNTTDFVEGFVASGQASQIFDRIIRSMGLRWSIQNNNIQILRQGRTNTTAAKRIASSTGLIGSPQRDKDGKVTCSVLIQPGLEPGKVVRVESNFVEGDYEIQQTTYKGATFGTNSDWKADLVLRPLR